MTTTATRLNPPSPKVICLGLGRTGTSSLRNALETLGFGPCYHMSVVVAEGGKDLPVWCKVGDGTSTPEDFDKLFRDYGSVLDYPAAMYAAELYAAYPDAKYILTTRDPAKWEKSMKATLLRAIEIFHATPNKFPFQETLVDWHHTYVQEKYHHGRIYTHTQQELLDHNERVKHIIPSEKLLVYELGDGWDKLVEFLGVARPEEPFPHVNDTAQFQGMVSRRMGTNHVKDNVE